MHRDHRRLVLRSRLGPRVVTWRSKRLVVQEDMQRRQLGKTDLHVPPIVFGSTSLGNLYTAIPDDVQLSIVKEWFEHVENPVFIDSAGKYGAGLSLENIGRHLQALNVAPEDVVISNKLAWVRTLLETEEPTFEPGVWVDLKYDAVQDISYDGMFRCYEQGNELLGDYSAQLVSVHDPDEYLAAARDKADLASRWEDISEAYRALQELKRDGHVAAIGVGAKDWKTVRDVAQRFPLDWVMIANSFTVHSHPSELVDFIREMKAQNTSVINSAVFNGGFLVGGDFYNYRRVDADLEDDRKLLDWRTEFFAVCDELKVKPAEACIAFGKRLEGVESLALSSSRSERVASNVELATRELPDSFWNTLRDRGLIDIEW